MKVIAEYFYHKELAKKRNSLGHHYVQEYVKSEFYCPSCGSKEVWEQQGEGDYYMGVNYVCTSCGRHHHLDSSGMEDFDPHILEQLRSGKTATPKTPKGN